MNKTHIKKLVLAAMFLAIGIVLPFFTGQIPAIGKALLPMHIPVLLCGLICGWQYGAVVGAVTPLLRSLLVGMPVMFPTAAAMAFELAAYGLVIGLVYGFSRWKCVFSVCRALVTAMLAGRVVWGIASFLMIGSEAFGWQQFLAGAFVSAVPGMILQIVLVPSVMLLLDKTHLVPFREGGEKCARRS